MSLIRRRYYIWLLKAYFKRWSKTILISLIFGVIFFFAIIFIINFYFLPRIQKKVQKIGYWGIYRTDTLPHEILSDISYGLTKVNPDGTVSPAASYSWQIRNNGKEYVFKIKKGQYFHNNDELTSKSLNLNFKDLWGRPLQFIDCQNLFCEVDKYARIAHPEFSGLTGRVRIKQKFRTNFKIINYYYPPKWGINNKIESKRNVLQL